MREGTERRYVFTRTVQETYIFNEEEIKKAYKRTHPESKNPYKLMLRDFFEDERELIDDSLLNKIAKDDEYISLLSTERSIEYAEDY